MKRQPFTERDVANAYHAGMADTRALFIRATGADVPWWFLGPATIQQAADQYAAFEAEHRKAAS